MKSFRSKPSGWQRESSRHSLAAKGIKTRRYNAIDPKKTAEMIHSMFDDGRAKTDDYAEQRKTQEVDVMRNDIVGRLREEEEKGNITFDNSQRFMNDQFTDETKDFLDGKIDHAKYKANVNSRLERHLQVHKRTLTIFGGE